MQYVRRPQKLPKTAVKAPPALTRHRAAWVAAAAAGKACRQTRPILCGKALNEQVSVSRPNNRVCIVFLCLSMFCVIKILLQTCCVKLGFFVESHSELYSDSSLTKRNSAKQSSYQPPSDPLERNYSEHIPSMVDSLPNSTMTSQSGCNNSCPWLQERTASHKKYNRNSKRPANRIRGCCRGVYSYISLASRRNVLRTLSWQIKI